MFRKLFLSLLALVTLALALLGILVARTTRGRVLDEVSRRLESEVEILRAIVRESPPGGLQETVGRVGQGLDSRFTVVAGDGRVLADSQAAPERMDNHSHRPEVIEARTRGRSMHVRWSDTLRTDLMYHAVPLEPSKPDGVVVRTALPLTRVQEELRALYVGITVAFGTTVLIGAAVAWMLARWLTRPLHYVLAVARTLSALDLDQRSPIHTSDEIGTVAEALHRMADELRARLERLRVESGKLEAVISSMQEGVIATGPGGEIVRLNGAAGGLFGLGSEAVGLKLWEAVRHPELEDAASRVLQGGPPGRVVLELGARSVSASLWPIAGGRGAVLVARDVTEERRYDALRKEFVANVSHELRTPLSVIQGYVETLRDGAWKDEQRSPEFLEVIDKNVRRLATLVGDLLDLSKLESGGQVVNPRSVDLGRLLEKVRDAFAPLAARKRQELTVEAGPPSDGFEADPELLERALSNLVDNAIKYTPEGGKVGVRVQADPESFSIIVEDNGIGIPEPALPRVFERFYRVDKSRSRDLGGTGLGLAIVKHVAQLHAGGVEAWSRPGQGSRFTLRIPRRPTRSTN